MNGPVSFIKCASLGLVAGVLISAGPDLGNDIIAMAGLMALVAIIVAVFDLTIPRTAASVVAVPIQATTRR